jgi:hypothetical protein
MNRELKIAIADLQRAFNKTDLASLSIAFSANGTIIDVTDVEGNVEKFELPSDAFDSGDQGRTVRCNDLRADVRAVRYASH